MDERQGDANLAGGSRYLTAVDGVQRLQSTLRDDYANELQASLTSACLDMPVRCAESAEANCPAGKPAVLCTATAKQQNLAACSYWL